jgi:ribosomal protein S18 acetylase RimI-like enzyme
MPDTIRIGAIRKKDRESVVEMFQTDLKALRISRSRETLLGVLDGLDDVDSDAVVFWGARTSDDVLVGLLLANVGWSVKHGGRSLWLEELHVIPSARRLGVGRRLVEELLSWSRSNHIAGIDLESYQLNAPAAILYRALGFRRLGRERFSITLEDE